MEINREKGSIEVAGVLYTAVPHTRHNPECKYAKTENSGSIASCDCRKSILVYNGQTRKQDRISAHTRSWAQATIQAEEWLDQFDPNKVEQKRREAQAVTIQKAVAAFIADKRFQNLSSNTIGTNQCLLGDADAEGNITREGKLFPWLAKQNPRITYVSEITSTHLLEWRGTWELSSLSAYIAWGTVKEFFEFCTMHGWTPKDPAINIKRPSAEKGNRTAIFTDAQYTEILKNAKNNDKLEALVLLLRWGAMAMVDATLFNIDSICVKGVLRYKRHKTGELATVQLPGDVVSKLHTISANKKQPFLDTSMKLESNIAVWRRALQGLFALAKIETVTTEVGERPPHPHMFRDTCIVGYLRDGMSLHSAARILGHSNTLTIQTHYLPFVKELEKTVLDETRDILEKRGVTV